MLKLVASASVFILIFFFWGYVDENLLHQLIYSLCRYKNVSLDVLLNVGIFQSYVDA